MQFAILLCTTHCNYFECQIYKFCQCSISNCNGSVILALEGLKPNSVTGSFSLENNTYLVQSFGRLYQPYLYKYLHAHILRIKNSSFLFICAKFFKVLVSKYLKEYNFKLQGFMLPRNILHFYMKDHSSNITKQVSIQQQDCLGIDFFLSCT